jgi:hypothetical protein
MIRLYSLCSVQGSSFFDPSFGVRFGFGFGFGFGVGFGLIIDFDWLRWPVPVATSNLKFISATLEGSDAPLTI